MFHRSISRRVRAEPVLPVVCAGALYIRRRPRVRLEPQMSGGGQERGLRSGTLPAPLIVGFGAACSVAAQEMEADRRCVPPPCNRSTTRCCAGLRPAGFISAICLSILLHSSQTTQQA